MPFALARVLARNPRLHLIMPGASTPLATLGQVEAGLELADQLPGEVDTVVAALGSGGTIVGLALGLALGGSRARVLAPLVSSPLVANRFVLAALETGTRALLAAGGLFPGPTRIEVTHAYRGSGYGAASDAGAAATARAAAWGVPLERTYTAKAFAAVLDRWRAGRRVVFVQTYAGPVNLGNEAH